MTLPAGPRKDTPTIGDTKAPLFDLTRDPNSHPHYTLEDGLLFFKGLIFVPHLDGIKRDYFNKYHFRFFFHPKVLYSSKTTYHTLLYRLRR